MSDPSYSFMIDPTEVGKISDLLRTFTNLTGGEVHLETRTEVTVSGDNRLVEAMKSLFPPRVAPKPVKVKVVSTRYGSLEDKDGICEFCHKHFLRREAGQTHCMAPECIKAAESHPPQKRKGRPPKVKVAQEPLVEEAHLQPDPDPEYPF